MNKAERDYYHQPFKSPHTEASISQVDLNRLLDYVGTLEMAHHTMLNRLQDLSADNVDEWYQESERLIRAVLDKGE